MVIELPASFRLADAIALQALTFRSALAPAVLLFPRDGALLVGNLALRVTFLVCVTMPGVKEPVYPLALCRAPTLSSVGSTVVQSNNVSARNGNVVVFVGPFHVGLRWVVKLSADVQAITALLKWER